MNLVTCWYHGLASVWVIITWFLWRVMMAWKCTATHHILNAISSLTVVSLISSVSLHITRQDRALQVMYSITPLVSSHVFQQIHLDPLAVFMVELFGHFYGKIMTWTSIFIQVLGITHKGWREKETVHIAIKLNLHSQVQQHAYKLENVLTIHNHQARTYE